MKAHLSSSSSIDDDVDAVISEALDRIALEQIAALNTAHLSPLPSHLASRFRRLKSLPDPFPPPATPPSPTPVPPHPTSFSPSSPSYPPLGASPPSHPPRGASPPSHPPRDASPPSNPSRRASPLPPPLPRDASPSPPRGGGCCFWFSPRGKKGVKVGEGDWGRDEDELLEELQGFSTKRERRRMKKVLAEVERANREADELVELAKHVSARMELVGLDELIASDDEELR